MADSTAAWTARLEDNQVILRTIGAEGLGNAIKQLVPFSLRRWDSFHKEWIINASAWEDLAGYLVQMYGKGRVYESRLLQERHAHKATTM